jgi:hypothetical protein
MRTLFFLHAFALGKFKFHFRANEALCPLLQKKDCSFETAVTSVDCGILEAVIAKLQLYCTLTAATLQIYCSKKNVILDAVFAAYYSYTAL